MNYMFKDYRCSHLLILSGIIIFLSRIIGSIVLPIYDDAFITLRYARNLAAGNGFVYHQSEWVLGTTAPGFGLLYSLFFLFHLPMPDTLVIFNILMDVVIFSVTITAIPSKYRCQTGIIFGLLFSFSPIMTRITVGGMEMNLFLILSITSVILYKKSRYYKSMILAAVCFYFRPEAVILLFILSIMIILSQKKKKAITISLTGCVTLTILLLMNYIFYGYPFSQSVMAKSSMEKNSIFVLIKGLLSPDPFIPILFLIALASGILQFYSGKVLWFTKIIAIWGSLYLLAYIIGNPKIWSWYGYPLYYCILVVISTGFALMSETEILKNIWRKKKKYLMPALILIILSPLVLWAGIMFKMGPSKVEKNVYSEIEKWSKNKDLKQKTICAGDIGAIGYYTDARIYDLAGLVWPEALKFDSAAKLIKQKKPDYLFFIASQRNIEMMNTSPFKNNYEPHHRFSKDNNTNLTLDKSKYSKGWKQDYILFKRINK